MNRFRKWAYIIAGGLALAYLASPYVSLSGFYFALKGANQAALLEMVVWESLRKSMREDINQIVKSRMDKLLGDISGARGKGIQLSLGWSGLPLVDEVTNILASPRGLIALFDNTKTIRCVLRGLGPGDEKPEPGKCFESEALPEGKTRKFQVEGPNFRRWFEKLNYAFFTDPFVFRLDVLHGGMRVVLILERQGAGWKVTRITIPFKELLAGGA